MMSTMIDTRILFEKSANISTPVDFNGSLNKSYPMTKFLTTGSCSPVPSPRPPLTKTYSDASAIHSSDNIVFITAKSTREMLSDKTNLSMPPIVDCRSQMDFGAERVRSAHNINCRAKLIARKLISKHLEEVEPALKVSFQHFDFIILYDQSTEQLTEEKISASPISLVVQAAKRSKKIVHIVQGGFEAIKKECPYLIECAIPVSNSSDQLPPIPATPEPIEKENLLMSEIIPRLFVGNACDAQNAQRLQDVGITHVVNATPDLPFCEKSNCKTRRISIRDLPTENIAEHFENVIEFLEKALSDTSSKVLVHCSAGISRSPTLVLAYMIKKQRMTFDEALKTMRKSRSIVDPNLGFIFQLRNWEKTCVPKADVPNPFANVRPHSTSRNCSSKSGSKKETNPCTEAPIPVK